MKKIIFHFCFLISNLAYADNIEILANFSLSEVCTLQKITDITGFNIRFNECDLNQYCSQKASKIILMNVIASPTTLSNLPRDKLVLFLWEPSGASALFCNLFSRVYTFDDNLVDGKQYFKFFYPVLTPMTNNLPSFEEQKLCVLIAQNHTKNRAKIIQFFETKPDEDFDYFGNYPLIKSDRYRGSIPSHPLSQEKFDTLKKYRFSVCFENSHINGYITEKIFSCFAGGCVPIYYGAPNVEDYIPKDCFIDYRDFKCDEELYQFIKMMSKETHQQYIENIKTYLQSEKAYLFSDNHFAQIIGEAIIN